MALGLLFGSCSSRRVVRIPAQSDAVAGAQAARALSFAALAIDAPRGIDARAEVRRFLASELRSRTPLVLSGAGDAPGEEAAAATTAAATTATATTAPATGTSAGAALELRGRGRFQESTAAMLGGNSIERETVLPSMTAPDRRARWGHGYALALDLELVDVASGAVVWQRSFAQNLPPRERTGPLFALYELLGPVADELVAALAGARSEERRVLLLP